MKGDRNMKFLKWICFLLVCLDVVGYVIEKGKELDSFGNLIGLLIGIAARVFVLYGTATCWLLS